MEIDKQANAPFTGYQRLVVFLLAMTQFTVVLDFMVMSPMGDILMKAIDLKPAQFGVAVSAYAFSAGASGLLTAGFADRFDRKKLLLFFYSGFIIGTFLCSFANDYWTLVAARIVTGLFGGVIGSISMAIITDIFTLQQRGRVMGFVQMGFGASQVLGIPIGLYIANNWGWHSAFLWIAVMALIIVLIIAIKLVPITAHIGLQKHQSALGHLWATFSRKEYRVGFLATALLSIGGYMMMPFGSAFAVNNLKVSHEQLPMLFMISGVASLIIMPIVGKLSDRYDKFKIFAIASLWLMIVVLIYTNLGVTPFFLVIVLNILMMAGILSRMTPSSALITAVPEMKDRGAFMSISSSLQQLAGGVAAALAGMIIVQQTKESPLEHYPTLGIIVVLLSIIGIIMIYRVSNMIKKRRATA
ncbi:MFS transporter [Sphingobacterium sp. N143]|uniref:MFS transporter n=1 Tax=Sphingobacterium sp. N143 TaxID=2746727 RepID=UPI002578A324|nr:MFS transporter [Sphingobacterium sp. N143]MDM1295084.1 MFS transporter [Sphingobacterium sp. N143]